ncbi:MAG TPA: Na+/H+ antiporter NhaC family protein [Pseudacidobacterium sp.]|jgi:NhaC family Na+:H+ antiporter|nr:Na+/H+ antiporter NhaC family protein [Pseudacidobacterium sp.]
MADESFKPRNIREPSYADAIIPAVTLIVLIAGAVFLFGLDALDGPVQVALILSTMVVALIILKNGHPWDEIVEAARAAFASITTPIFILFGIGALIGTWNMSGTIPTMVYYGIHLLHPAYFYIASLVICAVISLGIGSSWTTAGTIGVGLVGLAAMVGVSPAITAGAVVSGSYVGDKISPLSETTVLTAQLAKVEIYTHIRAMLWSTVPSFLIAAAVFTFLSLREGTMVHNVDTVSELYKLDQLFWITPWNLIPLVVLLFLSYRKVPPSLAILSSAILGGILAVFLQPQAVLRVVSDPTLPAALQHIKSIWQVMAKGYHVDTGIKEVDQLLSRGGMASMLYTLWIIIGAVTFGTLLEEFHLLSKLINPVLERARTTGRLIAAVVATAFGLNVIAADQYIALVLPVRLYRLEFEKRGLKAQNLSRACADAGTVTSPLVPWNSCGAYMAAALSVPTLVYLPFCIFNITAPFMSLFLGFTGFKIEHIKPAEAQTQTSKSST